MAQFESQKQEIEAAGAQAVFVAAQSPGGIFNPEKHLRDHPVSFPFLLDAGRAVTRAYGVYQRFGLDGFNIAHPATFVIDRRGMVRFIYVGASQTDRADLGEVLKAITAR